MTQIETTFMELNAHLATLTEQMSALVEVRTKAWEHLKEDPSPTNALLMATQNALFEVTEYLGAVQGVLMEQFLADYQERHPEVK